MYEFIKYLKKFRKTKKLRFLLDLYQKEIERQCVIINLLITIQE